MTQTALETNAASEYATLVTLTWGDANTVRLCRWDEDLTVGSDTFSHEPSLSVRGKEQHGGTEDAPMEIQARSSVSPFDNLSRLYPHARVSVTIEEVVPGNDATRQTVFRGHVGKVTAKPAQQGELVRCEVRGIKHRLKGVLGVQALTTCALIFGQSPCEFDLAASTLTGTVSGLSTDGHPNRVSVDLTGSPDMSNIRWNRGYLEIDGLRLTIRAVADAGTNPDPTVKLDLRRVPPPEWLNASVSVVPGCDKTIAACREHGQESQFLGLGYAMPGYNPLYEQG